MSEELLSRLETAIEKVLARNLQLTQKCRQLEEESAAWQQEKTELLKEIETILRRLDGLELEES